MKGMQRFRSNKDSETIGPEVQPIHVLFVTLGFIVVVILLHFFGKAVSAGSK